MSTQFVDRLPSSVSVQIERPESIAADDDGMPIVAMIAVRAKPGTAVEIIANAVRRAGTFLHERHRAGEPVHAKQ